jgi:hypothetical protein
MAPGALAMPDQRASWQSTQMHLRLSSNRMVATGPGRPALMLRPDLVGNLQWVVPYVCRNLI